MTRCVDRAGQRTDSPFQTRKLFRSRSSEVVVAKAVDDGVDGGVEAGEVARRVEKRAQPIGNLTVGHNLMLNNFVSLCASVCIVCMVRYAVDRVAQNELVAHDDDHRKRHVANDEADENEDEHAHDAPALGELLQLEGRARGRAPLELHTSAGTCAHIQ